MKYPLKVEFMDNRPPARLLSGETYKGIVLEMSGPPAAKCTCSLLTLLQVGCRCGVMDEERKAK